MPRIEIDLPDDLINDLEQIAKRLGKPLPALLVEILENNIIQNKTKLAKHSVKDIPPGRGLGKILKPWNSRAELLEDFFGREE